MPERFQSTNTFQIQRLPEKTTRSGFEQGLLELARKIKPRKGKEWQPKSGLAVDAVGGEKFCIGTVSCPSGKTKEKLMEQVRSTSSWENVIVSDHFQALTILHMPLDLSYPMAE
jgi:hypothetical protein